jgi:hypothetical protein
MTKKDDILLQFARDQEQLEAATEQLGKITSAMFQELVKGGMTRDEALDMVKFLIPTMMGNAKG